MGTHYCYFIIQFCATACETIAALIYRHLCFFNLFSYSAFPFWERRVNILKIRESDNFTYYASCPPSTRSTAVYVATAATYGSSSHCIHTYIGIYKRSRIMSLFQFGIIVFYLAIFFFSLRFMSLRFITNWIGSFKVLPVNSYIIIPSWRLPFVKRYICTRILYILYTRTSTYVCEKKKRKKKQHTIYTSTLHRASGWRNSISFPVLDVCGWYEKTSTSAAAISL